MFFRSLKIMDKRNSSFWHLLQWHRQHWWISKLHKSLWWRQVLSQNGLNSEERECQPQSPFRMSYRALDETYRVFVTFKISVESAIQDCLTFRDKHNLLKWVQVLKNVKTYRPNKEGKSVSLGPLFIQPVFG